MADKYRILLTIFVCAFFGLLVTAQDDEADLTPEGNIVIVDSAFVRGGPSNDYIAVGALFVGDEVFPVNISEDGQWILIPYSRGSGWVQRNLVRWEDEFELNQLPVLLANITPTPRIAITNTPFIPTNTPEGDYINVEEAASAYVRAGPGRGYLRLGQLLPGEPIEAVARNDDTTWVMIRYSDEVLIDGFAWLATDLIRWQDIESLGDLPVIDLDNLTPTVTFTPTETASITLSATISSTPTNTATSEPSATNTLTVTASPTVTSTASESPSQTPLPTATDTEIPTETATATLTDTVTPSDTATFEPSPTNTSTATESPSLTPVPTETDTAQPTATDTEIPTDTLTPTSTITAIPSETATEIIEVAIAVSETSTPRPADTATATEQASETPTETEMVTDIFAIQETSGAVEATNIALSTVEPPDPNILEEQATDAEAGRIPIEAIVGFVLLLAVLAYIWFYWQGLSAAGRYADGFVIDECPVCHRGHLHVDERQSRNFGIPTIRRTVRCDECRSVLRETGTQRWRYAVDRLENASLYDRLNGREVSDADLERLVKTPPSGAKVRTSPEFEENNPDEE